MKIIVIICMSLLFNSVNAQDTQQIIISLKFGANIPNVEQVYQEGQLSPPPSNHLIPSFDTATPVEVEYVNEIRAYGDLKNLITQ